MRAVATRALLSCCRLSRLSESWHHHRTVNPISSSCSSLFSKVSSIGSADVAEVEKPQPLWLASTMARGVLVGGALGEGQRVPSWVSKPPITGLQSALWVEAINGTSRLSSRLKHGSVQSYRTSSPSSSGSSSNTSSSFSTDSGSPSEKAEPKTTKILKQMLVDFGAVPGPALVLGIAGLIPFVALAPPLALMLPLPEALQAMHVDAQAAYGACIVTFLGAIHWGLAMADYAAPGKGHGVANLTLTATRYVWSVVPSLVAWTALLLPPAPKFALLIFSLGTCLGVDFLFARLKLVPSWYLALRGPLTLGAALSITPSLLVAAATNHM